jgi:hypothetical protein
MVQSLADIVQRLLDVAPVVYSALLVGIVYFEGCAVLVVVFDLFVVIGDFSGLFASAQFRTPFLSFVLFLSFAFSFLPFFFLFLFFPLVSTPLGLPSPRDHHARP